MLLEEVMYEGMFCMNQGVRLVKLAYSFQDSYQGMPRAIKLVLLAIEV